MSYTPTEWKDRIVEKPRTYHVQNNPDGTITLIPAPGTVVQEGTPVNAANLNKLEQGLDTHQVEKASKNNFGHVKIGDRLSVADGVIDGSYILGSYTGDGTDGREIFLGFKPSMVILEVGDNTYIERRFTIFITNEYQAFGVNNLGDVSRYTGTKLTDNGFQINNGKGNGNLNGHNYTYIAFR